MGFEVVNQALTNLFIGIGFALVNIVVRYFAPWVPQVISVLHWKNLRRALVFAYLIALVIQLFTSPFFRSYLHSAYAELAWSPYQAVFNVLGVVLMDVIVRMVRVGQRGAKIGGQQLEQVRTRVAEEADELGDRLAVTPEARATRQQEQAAAEAKAAVERKQRLDNLNKY